MKKRSENKSIIDEKKMNEEEESLSKERIVKERLIGLGYKKVGIENFEMKDEDIEIDEREGNMNRNFKGYKKES